MVWYLPDTWGKVPITWFEDLGAANRVSVYSYDNQKLDVNTERNWVYSASCKVRLPDGRVCDESYSEYTTSPWTPDTRRPLMAEMRNKLRRHIREKYPKTI